MKQSTIMYWVVTSNRSSIGSSVQGPYKSRRKANKSRYIKSHQCIQSAWGPTPMSSIRELGVEPKECWVRSMTWASAMILSDVINIDNDMLAYAR